jgi:uncharacterized membrane protein
MAQIKRIFRHLTSTRSVVNKAFPSKTLGAIEQAIEQAEASHRGEIRFVVEGALDGAPLLKGLTARERAIDVFSQLRMWDTELRTGVLIYLLMSDRQIEIVADRGIDAFVGHDAWSQLCRQLEVAFKEGHFEEGAFACVQAVTTHLQKHFPASPVDTNELPNTPLVL